MAFNINALRLPTIQRGSTGSAVGAWQRFLQDQNYPIGAVDNGFGTVADRVTRDYQQKNGLVADGVVGRGTYTKALSQGFIYRVAGLTAAMLLSYLNYGLAEVQDLQRSLNAIGRLNPPLTIDGNFGFGSTKGMTEAYKILDVNFRPRLDAQLSNQTKQRLGADYASGLAILTEYARRQRSRLSGAQWVRFFPASSSIDDLASPFRQRVQAFEKALRDAGASITVTNTYRPPQRAYMMHYAVQLNNRDIAPWDVPPMAGIDIDWVHYTDAASYQAARDMVNAFDIGGNPAALVSRHTQALAIDWIVTWKPPMRIRNGNGQTVSIGTPAEANNNADLWDVGATYGVYKLEYDPPHWSVDGY
ncbi:peptidoglycan-binding domain 1 protein [Leptolyngbya sp. NIES-3755]|nr:peptidoglycan-binding domain 1 protein [Leptolyngbya sp. NIES-3755]